MSTALVIDSSNLRNIKPQVFSGILVAKNQDVGDFANAIPVSGGTGAPTHSAAVVNELYIRTDATTGTTTLYRAVDTAGVWETLSADANRVVIPTLTVAGGASGATAGTLSLQLKQSDGTTNVTATRQVMIVATATQYAPVHNVVSTVTFATATVGSIIASGNGWALVLTSATGAFVCVPSDSADETVYFRCITAPGVSDQSKHCLVSGSNSDDAVWSA